MPNKNVTFHTSMTGEGLKRLTIAGPGHAPPSPHPAPNSTPPTMSFVSIARGGGYENVRLSIGFWSAPLMMMPCISGRLRRSALPMTNMSDGSQDPEETSRNCATLRGLVMPLTPRPSANNEPSMKVTRDLAAFGWIILAMAIPVTARYARRCNPRIWKASVVRSCVEGIGALAKVMEEPLCMSDADTKPDPMKISV